MKHFFSYFLAVVAVCFLAACSDDDPVTIEFINGQSDKMNCWANTSEGKITFKAAEKWTAHVEAPSRANDDISWIHLDRTSGSAGDINITYTLDHNWSGEPRTVCIVIVCGDSRVTITITQSPESNLENTSKQEASINNVFKNGCYVRAYDKNNFNYVIGRNDKLQLNYITENITMDETWQKIRFVYDGPYILLEAELTQEKSELIGYKKNKYEIELGDDQPFIRTAKEYHDDEYAGIYNFEYDSEGHLTKVDHTYVYLRETPRKVLTELIWEGGNLTKMVINSEQPMSTAVTNFKYGSIENKGGLMLFREQLQMGTLPDGLYLAYFAGILGMPTKNLIQSWERTEDRGINHWVSSATFEYWMSDGLPIGYYPEIKSGDDIVSNYFFYLNWN